MNVWPHNVLQLAVWFKSSLWDSFAWPAAFTMKAIEVMYSCSAGKYLPQSCHVKCCCPSIHVGLKISFTQHLKVSRLRNVSCNGWLSRRISKLGLEKFTKIGPVLQSSGGLSFCGSFPLGYHRKAGEFPSVLIYRTFLIYHSGCLPPICSKVACSFGGSPLQDSVSFPGAC